MHAMVSQEYKKKFESLSHYIKWIIDNTELQICRREKMESPTLLDSAQSHHYIIQSRIINNKDIEVNLEIILKLTTFSGDQIYSVVCKNRNLLIKLDKLQQGNKLRSLLVGQISHDLRTPLNSIMVLLNLALTFKGIPKIFTEEYIKPALTNCNLLMNLINDILDFTREDFDQQKQDPNMEY